jgi:hypothetical protein
MKNILKKIAKKYSSNEVYIDSTRTKTGIIITTLPRPEKGHYYKIVPSSDGYYTNVYVVDVVRET